MKYMILSNLHIIFERLIMFSQVVSFFFFAFLEP
jgi:hypothetical protein